MILNFKNWFEAGLYVPPSNNRMSENYIINPSKKEFESYVIKQDVVRGLFDSKTNTVVWFPSHSYSHFQAKRHLGMPESLELQAYNNRPGIVFSMYKEHESQIRASSEMQKYMGYEVNLMNY